MRLTVDLLKYIQGYINPIREREICLRGYKIPMVENLGILKDQYDVVDLSDNSITCLDNFPLMKRLTGLIAHNNKIASFGIDIGAFLPKLENLVLTNNGLKNLAALDGIETLSNLQRLVLVGNDVTKEKGYRLYVVARLPNLRHLDFQKVSQNERKEAHRVFGTKAGKTRAANLRKKDASGEAGGSETRPLGALDDTMPMTTEQRKAITEAIQQASSIDEIDRLEGMLKSGRIPRDFKMVRKLFTLINLLRTRSPD